MIKDIIVKHLLLLLKLQKKIAKSKKRTNVPEINVFLPRLNP